jgi:hypothetical protein
MTLAEWKEAREVMAERRVAEKGMYEGAEADTFPELSAGIVPADGAGLYAGGKWC